MYACIHLYTHACTHASSYKVAAKIATYLRQHIKSSPRSGVEPSIPKWRDDVSTMARDAGSPANQQGHLRRSKGTQLEH